MGQRFNNHREHYLNESVQKRHISNWFLHVSSLPQLPGDHRICSSLASTVLPQRKLPNTLADGSAGRWPRSAPTTSGAMAVSLRLRPETERENEVEPAVEGPGNLGAWFLAIQVKVRDGSFSAEHFEINVDLV